MINYGQYQPANSTQIPAYAGSIAGDMINVGQKLQERFDTAQSQDDMLKRALRSTTSLPQDREFLNSIVDRYNAKMKDRASRGNYENMMRETAMDAQDFMQDYQPIAQNSKRYADYQEKLSKLVDGGMRPEKAQRLLQASVSSYKGLQRDEDGRVTNYFSGMDPVKDVNLPEKVDKYMKDLAPSVIGTKVHNVNGKWMTVSGSKVKEITAAQIDRVLAAAAAIDPELQGWLNQEAELNTLGYDRVTLKDIKDPLIASKLADEAVRTGLPVGVIYREMAKGQERLRILNGMRQYADKYRFKESETESGITGANSYEVARYSRDLEKQDQGTWVPTQGVSAGLNIQSAGDLQTQDQALDTQLNSAVTSMQDFVAGMKRRSADGEYYSRKIPRKDRNGDTYYEDRRFIKDKDGKEVDVTTEWRMKAEEVQRAKEQKDEFEKVKQEAMDESGYSETIKKDTELIKRAQEAYNQEFGKETAVVNIPGQQSVRTPLSIEERKQNASKEYNRVLQASKPYKQYLNVLQNKLNSAPETDATYVIADPKIRENMSASFSDLISNIGGDASNIKLTSATGENMDVQLTPNEYDELKGAITITGFSTDKDGKEVLVARAHSKIKGKNTEGKDMLIRIPNIETDTIRRLMGDKNYMQYRRTADLKAKLNNSPAKSVTYTDFMGNDYKIKTITDHGTKKYLVQVPSTKGIQEIPVTSREGVMSVIDAVNRSHLQANPALAERMAETQQGQTYLKLLGYE